MIRPLLFTLALATLAAAYLLPWMDWLGFFPRHMVQHMALVALAAPLLVLALPGRGPVPPVLPAALIEFAVVWAWHLPALHGFACMGGVWKVAEQSSFLAAGLLVWRSALAAEQPLAGAGGLLLTSMHMTLLGALLTLAPAPLYSGSCALCGSLPGQQLGGILMLALGTPVYLVGGLWLVSRALGTSAGERAA
jgi:putative membrane protein